MQKLINSSHLNKSIINLINYAEKRLYLTNFQIVKYLKHNKISTSKKLDEYIIHNFKTYYEPIKNTVAAQPELNNRYHQSLLKSACSSDADLLSYKGINLGSAINMKLAVKLGSLLGKQQG